MQITLPVLLPENQNFKKHLLQRSSNRRLLGGLEHPLDGRTRISECCFVVDYFDLKKETVTLTLVDNPIGRIAMGLAFNPSNLRFSIQTSQPVMIHGRSDKIEIYLRSVAIVIYSQE